MENKIQITAENCHVLTAQCCAYYSQIIQKYEHPNRSLRWHQMRDVAETWRRILSHDTASVADIEELETMIQPLWNVHECATTWIVMATGIDLWLRSIGRAGLGPNPWYGDRIPNDVRPMF